MKKIYTTPSVVLIQSEIQGHLLGNSLNNPNKNIVINTSDGTHIGVSQDENLTDPDEIDYSKRNNVWDSWDD